MEYAKLANETQMPMLGYGVFQIAELDAHKSICFGHTDLTTVGDPLGFIKTQP